MKDKIRQILREEILGFDPKELEQLYKFMNFLTRDYRWYTYKPKESDITSTWLINPKTKEWLFELQIGDLFFYEDLPLFFKRYFNMEENDSERFLRIWVEDVLNREVYESYSAYDIWVEDWVEDILKNGEELK